MHDGVDTAGFTSRPLPCGGRVICVTMYGYVLRTVDNSVSSNPSRARAPSHPLLDISGLVAVDPSMGVCPLPDTVKLVPVQITTLLCACTVRSGYVSLKS